MKPLQLFITLFCLILIFSCSKESSSPDLSRDKPSKKRDHRDCEINLYQLSEEDQLKYVLAEFINEALQQDELRTYLLSNLYNSDRDGYDPQNPEFLIAEHLSDAVNVGNDSRFGLGQGISSTLEDVITHWITETNPDQITLFQNLCSQYSDFIFHFPWWGIDIINDANGIENVSLGSIGAIAPVECDGIFVRSFFHEDQEEIINVKAPLKKYIPIYVKRAELHIKVINDPQETLDEIVENLTIFYEDCSFSENDLLAFMKTIDCSDLQFVDFARMAIFFKKNCSGVRHHETNCCDGEDNDGDGLVDCDDVEDCPCNVEICNDGCDNDNDGHIDSDDDDCQCVAHYQRDCVVEDNVNVGLKFDDAAWLNVCQLKEEAHIHVLLDLDAVLICNQAQGSHCPEDELTDITIQHKTEKFFEIQKKEVPGSWYDNFEGEFPFNVLWVEDDGFYKKLWIVYPLYAAYRKHYLEKKKNQWIPSDIGSYINITAFELDNASVTATDSYTKTITSRHALNPKKTEGLDELVSTTLGFLFDNTMVSTATSVTNVNFQKDVFINNYSLHYWDKDEVIPDPTGVEGNTWYGQVPGNSGTGLDGLYLEFRIHD